MKKWITSIVQYGLLLLIVYFIWRNIKMRPQDIWSYLLYAGPYFYWGLALFVGFLAFQSFLWVKLLNDSEVRLTNYRGILIYTNSQFAKYVPGGFWNFVGRVYMTRKYGVELNDQLPVLLYENVFLIYTSLFYALLLGYNLNWVGWPWLLLTGLLVVLLYARYDAINRMLEKGLNRFIRKFSELRFTLPKDKFFRFLTFYAISHLLQATAFWLLLQSFGVRQVQIFDAAGIFALSWLIGFLSPLPGGIGVREGALSFLLSQVIQADLAVQISIMTRIWNIMGETLLFCIMNSIEFLRQRMRQS